MDNKNERNTLVLFQLIEVISNSYQTIHVHLSHRPYDPSISHHLNILFCSKRTHVL